MVNVSKINELVFDYCREQVTGCQFRSLPIPDVSNGAMLLLFLHCPIQVNPQKKSMLFSPQYLTTMNMQGYLEEVRAITPSEFGQKAYPGKEIGVVDIGHGFVLEQYSDDLDKLFSLYDVLLPEFQNAGRASAEHKLEFGVLFKKITEPPLFTYYKTFGKSFFSWVGLC